MMRLPILFLLLLCVEVRGASWYADNSLSSSANTGTSWASAWTNFASVVWGGAGVKAGDTLFISGGTVSQTYRETNNVNGTVCMLSVGGPSYVTGTAGNPITVTVGEEAGHNGTVYLDGANGLPQILCSSFYNVIRGGTGKTNLWFVNCVNPADRISGVGILGTSGTHNTFYNLGFSNLNNGIYFYAGADLEVSSNRFVDIRGDGAISITGGDPKFGSLWIHHNYISCSLSNLGANTIWGPDGVKWGQGATIEDNEITHTWGTISGAQHPDAVQCANGGNFSIIRRNKIHIPSNAAFELGTSQHVQEIYIENNLVWLDDTNVINAGHPFVAECGGESVPGGTLSISNVFILNNTFVDSVAGFGWEWDKDGVSQPTVTNFVVKNNLVFNCDRLSNNDTFFWVLGTYVNTNFTDACVQYDYNSECPGALGTNGFSVEIYAPSKRYLTQAHGNAVQPTFVSYGYALPGNDLRLASNDAAALGRGTDLSAYFTTDLEGNSRAVPWSIGAYQASVTNAPAPALNVPPSAPPGRRRAAL